MKILITGAAGYIGTALLEKLVQDIEVKEIVLYDNLSRGNKNVFLGSPIESKTKLSFVQADLLDSRSLAKALKGVNLVYHLAANVTTPFSDQNPHLFEQVNNWGTAELVQAIEENPVEKFVHLSSVSVYGTGAKKLEATAPLNPKTFYGISKMRAEEHVKRLEKNTDCYIIRCGNVYGYNKSMRFDAVINKFMFDANFTNRITVNGTGEQKRPFISINTVSDVLKEIVSEKIKAGTYNLVGNNWAIGEVVEALRTVYPNVEMLFVNQHMKMRELQVRPSEELAQFYSSQVELTRELEEFKSNFAF